MTTELATQAQGLIDRATQLKVESQADYDGAGALLRDVKTAAKRWNDYHAPTIDAITASLDAARRARDLIGKPLADLEKTIIKPKMLAWWSAEQAKIKAAEEAQRRETERMRRIEEDKRLAEAQAKEDEARFKREAALDAATHEEAKALEQAAARDTAAAAALITAPLDVPVGLKPPTPPAPKAEGTAVRMVWKARVDDLRALAKAVGEGKVGTNVLEPVNGALVKIAQAFEGKADVPGVTFYQEPSLSGRTR